MHAAYDCESAIVTTKKKSVKAKRIGRVGRAEGGCERMTRNTLPAYLRTLSTTYEPGIKRKRGKGNT